MSEAQPVNAFFVYGTLQRGQCRQRCWPVSAKCVDRAFVRGVLYDLGEYPGLLAGDDWVAGERWELDSADMSLALDVLDREEGHAQPGEADLYDRRLTTTFAMPDGPTLGPAYVYLLKDLRMLQRAHRIDPSAAGQRVPPYAQWPAVGAS